VPRGRAAKIGDTFVNANGYHHTRTEGGWRLTHHIVAEKLLGRALTGDETVRFKDGNRKNLDPANLVIKHKRQSKGAARARLEAKIMELKNELEALDEEDSDKVILVNSS
jgi:hypothetical protein